MKKSKVKKTLKPAALDEEKLLSSLGRSQEYWDQFLSVIPAGATCEWKHYASLSGWRYVVRRRGRNLVYLSPQQGSFLASFALSDAALDRAQVLGVQQKVLTPIRQSPKYAEGRAARILVRNTGDLRMICMLLEAKCES